MLLPWIFVLEAAQVLYTSSVSCLDTSEDEDDRHYLRSVSAAPESFLTTVFAPELSPLSFDAAAIVESGHLPEVSD
jgi:hypothetical protein